MLKLVNVFTNQLLNLISVVVDLVKIVKKAELTSTVLYLKN